MTTWTTQKDHGTYEIISPLGLPKHFDKIVLYSILHKLYRENKLEKYVLTTNRHEIAKNIFDTKHFGKNVYARIMKALKKWTAISINFDGLFYEADEHTNRSFHIVDEYILKKESGELTIRFNESYIKQLKETKFYKLIDFEQYKKLSRASSARLYEILVKNYKERNEWAINIQALAEKLTFEKREKAQNYYPSDVLRYLQPSINEINKKTDLEINFSYNKDNGVCVFKKVEKKKVLFRAAVSVVDKQTKSDNAKKTKACISYFQMLSVEEQQVILDEIKKDQYLRFIPDQHASIFAYMTKTKQWQPKE